MTPQIIIIVGVVAILLRSEAYALIMARNSHLFRMSTAVKAVASPYTSIIDGAIAPIKAKVAAGEIPEAFAVQVSDFMGEYAESSAIDGLSPEKFQANVGTFLQGVGSALKDPYKFAPNHKAIREPFDYYSWGNDFMRPLIVDEESKVFNVENCKEIETILARNENVVFLSNHQTEADPQVLSILLEQSGFSALAEKVIFIAGHKVTNDPIAIPFSMGRNLLCIHSKKHIKNPPEDIPKKQAQNLESMKAMGDLAGEGGNIFWVAPSGGRDRPDETSGEFVVAPFDFKALDMFKLVGMQSRRPIHFFPMAMFTHKLVPPPSTTESSLGEKRSAKRGAVSVKFLPKTDGLGGLKDKEFTAEVQAAVNAAYAELVSFHTSSRSSGSDSGSSHARRSDRRALRYAQRKQYEL
jgi:glycerol-3-phosphate O-acyltransferase